MFAIIIGIVIASVAVFALDEFGAWISKENHAINVEFGYIE